MDLPQSLVPFADRIAASTRPALSLSIDWQGEAPSTGSFFGGTPHWPADQTWPMHEYSGPLHFVAQLDLATLPWRPDGLPADGLLQFFTTYADVEFSDPQVFITPRDVTPAEDPLQDPSVTGWFDEMDEDDETSEDSWQEAQELFGSTRRPLTWQLFEQPMTIDDERALQTLGFDGTTLSVEDADAYNDFCRVLDWPAHQLGGHLIGIQGDPREDPADELLLRLTNDGYFEWGDTGAVQWFWRPGDLASVTISEATT